jgi:hypothetical protein
MRTCQQCGESFRDFYVENETIYDFSRRKYCVNCRPITPMSAVKSEQQPKRHSHKREKLYECEVCSKPLRGNQRRFCSVQCKTHFHSSYPKQKDRAIVRKLHLIELSGGACAICGYNKNITAFHFHHVDPLKKRFRMDSQAISNRSWESILEEFEKCILLCGNCHAELHNPDLIYEELKAQFSSIET